MAGLPPAYSEVDPASSSSKLPGGAPSSPFGILKDAGKTQNQQGYIDAAGNYKHISPAQTVNLNQFYPSVDSASPEQMDNLTSDSWGTAPRQNTVSSMRLGIIEEASPSAETGQLVVREISAVSVASGDPPPYGLEGPAPSSMFGDRRHTTMTSDTGSVSDSISLPATATPPQSRDNSNLFSTAVDEETLAAAKRRQKKPRSLFQTEDWEKVKPVRLSMTQVIDTRSTDHYQLGMQHMQAMYYERAINCFNKALNLRPVETEYYIQRAECYLQLCDFQSAILNYKRSCVLDPDNFTYYSRLAFIYYFQVISKFKVKGLATELGLKRHTLYLQNVTQTPSIPSPSAKISLNKTQGQCLFDQRLFPEALESFSRAAEMRPEVIGYHTRSIACLAALQRHGECLALVNKRLETEELNADLYVMRARLHELFRNITLCYYDIKDALSLEPTHHEAVALMHKLELKACDMKQQAMHLNLLNRHRDALQKITLAIETNPAIAEYHVLRGALNRRLGDFNGAIDDYLLALDKTDHNEESEVYLEAQRQLLLTYNDFAVECFTKGFYEEAIILLNKAIKGEKREKGLYINRGDCFFRQDHLQFALADYHQALEMAAEDDNIRSRIAIVHNEHGIVEYIDKNYQEAESRFTLAIQHCPRVGQYYISRARARQVMENMSGARQDVLMALHLDPGNEEIINVLSRLFPGKSVKDVMYSRAAAAARTALQNLVIMAGPVRLKPIDGGGTDRSERTSTLGTEDVDGPVLGHPPTLKPSPYMDLKRCMQERDFHIKIAAEKAKVNQSVKVALHSRVPLCYKGGRVGALPAPSDVTVRSKHPLQKEALAVSRPQGWRTFSLGVGSGTIADGV